MKVPSEYLTDAWKPDSIKDTKARAELGRHLDALVGDVDELRLWREQRSGWRSWTPGFVGTGTAGTFTYFSQFGRYVRMGDLCFFNGVVAISAITVAPTGNMRISGLPFTASNTGNAGASFSFIGNFNYTAAALQLTGAIVAATNYISLYESFDNAAAVAAPAANFTNAACNLQFHGFYQVAGL